MIIAFSADDKNGLESQISHHFGRCPYYIFVEVEDGKIKLVKAEDNPYYNSHGPGVVPQYIASKNANFIVAGGMGPRAVEFFEQYGVSPIIGVTGIVKDVVDDIIAGKYKVVSLRNYNPMIHDRHKGEIDHDRY